MLRQIVIMAALAAISVPALAGTPRLDAREHNQRHRIVQGVRSGELTRPETRRLVAGERRLHRHERYARSDGTVTPGERARLERNADRMSQRIYRQKHDPQSR
ncbi:MAG: hypothetical protein EXR87_03585 [Gammaproteobacteria bacterium]|nr:hypothetical protein [Gammaproteobacteria bacterium]